MEQGIIKSFKQQISLEDYLECSDTLDNSTDIVLGNISLTKFKNPIRIQHGNFIVGIFKDGSSISKAVIVNEYGIITSNTKETLIYVDVVLKEQIKNLKHVEQLNLFENNEERKD